MELGLYGYQDRFYENDDALIESFQAKTAVLMKRGLSLEAVWYYVT